MKNLCLLAVFITLQLVPLHIWSQAIVISQTSINNSFPLVAAGKAAHIVVDYNDAEVVLTAAQAFSEDIALLTNVRPSIGESINALPTVIFGTLGKSTIIDQLAASDKINKQQLEGKWESFIIKVIDNPLETVNRALVIAGSDPRGTAFGIFELSRIMGVSPWIWWADVKPATREAIFVSGSGQFGPPSIKYRGMFINDEDFGMKPWAANKMDKNMRPNGSGDIGPRTHEKIFELMLRTKSNFFWPAMHACTWAFWYYPANPEVARKYDIVLGSSHCEQMLRNNEDEWKRNFTNEYPGINKGDWNWKTNSTVVKQYWTDRVKQSKGTHAIYTLGMRGVHDEQMEGYGSDVERAAAVKEIIGVQRTMLETNLGKPKATIPQLFCPYKEVLPQYNIGIDLPDDVTLLWPDDNHGFIRQLSTPAEQARSGGSGVYYHFSYWGPPHQSYLWLTSTSPVKISYEMSKAFDMNAKDIWIFNVGDLKHAEFEYQFAMDLAWDVDKWRPEKAHLYFNYWAEEIFGADLAPDISEIKKSHYFLTASGRPEHVDWYSMSVSEMENRLNEYSLLVEKVKILDSRIPLRLKDAFFELVSYPVLNTAAMNEKILGAKLSFEYAREGNIEKTMEVSNKSRVAYETIKELTYYYNSTVAGGKWDKMINYAPRQIGFFYEPDVVDELTIENEPIPAEITSSPIVIGAANYEIKSNEVKVIEQLGVNGASLTVLPFNMTIYSADNITSAPFATYKVKLFKGNNKIRIKCLPTFPLYPGLNLRYAVSIDGNEPVFFDIARLENDSEWRANILRGYAKNDLNIVSEMEKEVMLKIYFADPGLVLSGLEIPDLSKQKNDMTHLLVNPDFELDSNGNLLMPGTLNRGTPAGWSYKGILKGNSWGTNQDAINFNGEHVCWYSSDPMPSNFELSQTVKNLPAGEYVVRCRLGVPIITTQRLFANNNVVYFGKESDYGLNITEGETNSFAGYTPGHESNNGTMIELREMALKFVVLQNEDVVLGIRSSNKLSDGTFIESGRSGWFKTDYFRIERIRELTDEYLKEMLEDLIEKAQILYNTTTEGDLEGQYSESTRKRFQTSIMSAQTVYNNQEVSMTELYEAVQQLQKGIEDYNRNVITFTSYIKNASFEFKSEGVLNEEGATVYGTPYGWLDTEGIKGTSFGINKDANNKDEINACWYNSLPNFPSNFELYQYVGGLPAGEYTVRCRMSVPNYMITTQSLFANNNIQYYGKESDYGLNIEKGENVSFAQLKTSGNHTLQEMEVDVIIRKDETLKLGVRTSNKKADGSAATNNAGWFKVDNFRLELKELYDETGLNLVDEKEYKIISEKGGFRIVFNHLPLKASLQVFSLAGRIVYNSYSIDRETLIRLPRGLYVIKISFDGKEENKKILIV